MFDANALDGVGRGRVEFVPSAIEPQTYQEPSSSWRTLARGVPVAQSSERRQGLEGFCRSRWLTWEKGPRPRVGFVPFFFLSCCFPELTGHPSTWLGVGGFVTWSPSSFELMSSISMSFSACRSRTAADLSTSASLCASRLLRSSQTCPGGSWVKSLGCSVGPCSAWLLRCSALLACQFFGPLVRLALFLRSTKFCLAYLGSKSLFCFALLCSALLCSCAALLLCSASALSFLSGPPPCVLLRSYRFFGGSGVRGSRPRSHACGSALLHSFLTGWMSSRDNDCAALLPCFSERTHHV